MGLIAHECSHLKEGDTALNIRLMGMVAGLEMVWDFGRSLIPEPEADDKRRNEDWRWQLRTFQTPLAALGLVFGPIIIAAQGAVGHAAGAQFGRKGGVAVHFAVAFHIGHLLAEQVARGAHFQRRGARGGVEVGVREEGDFGWQAEVAHFLYG